MRRSPVVVLGFAFTALIAACSSDAPVGANVEDGGPRQKDDGAGSADHDASSSDPSPGDSAAPIAEPDAGAAPRDAGHADASHARDASECVRPPYQTGNECSGIGTPNGPALPSCSTFDGNGQLVCPTIPGCTVVPDPSGTYCTGDGVHCALSDCGHICALPNWEPCYDVSTGECLEGC